MIKTIATKTGYAVRKSCWFVAVKHKYALWFAIGMTLLAAFFAFIGTPLMVAHQTAMANLAATLQSHSYWVILSHILIISAIYLALNLWIEHLIKYQEVSEEAHHQAVKFVRIFIATLLVIMLLGHL